MQIHVIDKVFDELPDLNDVNNYRILPMDELMFNIPLQMQSGITLTKISHFPKKYLTYLGNIKGPFHKSIESWDCTSWFTVEGEICRYLSVWEDKTYDTIAEGVYECSYPRR